MKKEIRLGNKKVVYMLRKSRRARRMRLAVYCDGSIVITTPLDLRENIAERFIQEKANWLFSKTALSKEQTIIRYSHDDYLKHKEEAYILAVERTEHFNKTYKFRYNKIKIKNQKTRWGSCSKKGNLNFNYKIALLSQQLSDYIIVHELCHLKEFNHSKKFWKLVEKAIPDYIKTRNELKRSKIGF